ncbi:MAG TPA: hypothetical protein VLA01_04125 [Nitrosopumilaceae archaeon]|nr:hypothetical protein [Nitrosopumilaceae archaeon]
MINVKIGIIITIVTVAAIASTIMFAPNLGTQPTITQNEKIGLIVNTPSNSITLEELNDTYSQATSTGVGRNNLYLFWNLIEPEKRNFDWQQSDILMSFNQQNNLKVTLYFSLINGKSLGPFPDWIGKPNLNSVSEDSMVNVLDAILTRYDIIDTVIIAGDTDIHFRYNEQNIPVYKELFNGVYSQIKEKHPEVKFGNSFSLHGVINKNLGHIVQELDIGDFVAFSYFPVDALNEINKTPQEARNDLDSMLNLVPSEKTIGIFEISWSTDEFVSGNTKDQSDFVNSVFDFYQDNESKLEFVTWYRQYDRQEGTCVIDPATVEGSISISGDSRLGSSEYVAERLGHYICSAGLIETDGKPKPAWDEFSREVQMSSN